MKPTMAPDTAAAGTTTINGIFEMHRQNDGGESADREKGGMAERDLPAKAGQDHQPERTDAGEKAQVDQVQEIVRRAEGQHQRSGENERDQQLLIRPAQYLVGFEIAGAKIGAGARHV